MVSRYILVTTYHCSCLYLVFSFPFLFLIFLCIFLFPVFSFSFLLFLVLIISLILFFLFFLFAREIPWLSGWRGSDDAWEPCDTILHETHAKPAVADGYEQCV